MNFKNFYIKYRGGIFIATTVLTSIILAYAIDRYVLRKNLKQNNENDKNNE